MDDNERAIIEAGELAVERAKTFSTQPRFSGSVDSIFGALQRWVKLSEDLQIPDYRAKSRQRDRWLAEFWNREPHWAGVVSQLTTINAGRGWSLTGGRNQVYRYTDILHGAENGLGWRHYLKLQVQSYYTADMNAVTELGRSGRNGPLRALYHVDPSRLELSGDPKFPLKYYPPRGRLLSWRPQDYFRVSANPSNREEFNGLGFCATSMAYELVKMLYGIWMHDQEKVGAKMPEGIMLLDGVGEQQWNDALEAREAKLDAKTRRYFGGLFVFFNEGMDQLDYKLIALSDLPPNFDRETFIDQTMFGYALIVGADPSEFWPVQSGALGRGRETEIQHRKAASKGAMEFAVAYQEQLQNELPDSLLFEFEQRDEEGELLEAEVAQAWADVAKTLYEAGSNMGMPLLEREYVLSLLADKQVIPPEWTEIEEEVVATDTDAQRQKQQKTLLLERAEVRRAAEMFPADPIVRYRWPSGKITVLWDRGDEALGRRVWPVERQDDSEVLYADPDGDFTITERDVDRAIAEGAQRVGAEFAELLEAEPMTPEEEAEVAEG